MTRIVVYGKPNCGLCEAAKDKLKRMGLEFTVRNIEGVAQQWCDDVESRKEIVAVHAEYVLIDKLPVIVIGEDAMSYPKAMKALKEVR